ncbi:hypothetical protein [Nocardia salmonicida]|uniref:hypothetical protein n=1 Tax=Nocardia salmonicida TaxID=53431 RepID=UPI0007C837AC|nr:hypothetical protein [Nocardia salmonicida]
MSALVEQFIGRVTDRQPFGSGRTGNIGTYYIHVGDDRVYSFSYLDIVTEGFRTIRVGERVRFLTDPVHPGKAVFVIRLDLPDVEEYYQ